MENRALTEKEASQYLGLSIAYLRYDRCYGAHGGRAPGPRWVKLGRAVRYLKEDLDNWLEAHRVDRPSPHCPPGHER